MSLGSRLAPRFLFGPALFGTLLFLPAGTLKFWQGWTYLMALVSVGLLGWVFVFRHNPQLVERRMQFKEKVGRQKVIITFMYLTCLVAYAIPGLDHRFGWSHVPLWLTVFSQAMVLAGWVTAVWVMKVNPFAARTIRVEPGQPVISRGPYSIIRHPMYLGASVMLLFTPLALGSYFALPVFVLLTPLIVLRLLNEEAVLRQELPGYTDYCLRTRFRLVPFLW